MKARAGITLLEILIAVAILSFAVIPLILVVSSGTEVVRGTRDVAGAVFVAQQTLEECRKYRFYDLDGQDPICPQPSRSAEAELNRKKRVDVGAVAYERKVDIRPVSSYRSLKARLVHVKISWWREEKHLNYEVSTIISSVR